MKTHYWELRQYIDEKDPEFIREFEELYNIQPLDNSEPWYTDEAQKRWNRAVDYDLWSEFERFMGNPNTTEMLERSISVTENMPTMGIRFLMDQYWKKQFGFINKLQDYVREWIESIDTSHVACQKKSLTGSRDLFLNFNYTDILEKIYGIENVLHIHGGVKAVCDIPPIMGHCNKQDIQKHRQWSKEAAEEFAEAEASIQSAVADYLETIYKDTQEQIKFHRKFFDKLREVNCVVIIGWSAGDADIPYLKEINKCVCPNTKWIAYWYDNTALNSLESVFEKEGIVNIEYIQSDEFWDV